MLEKIKEVLAQYVETEPDEITEDSRLVVDLGLSSYALMSLMGDLEEQFGITVDEAELTEIRTIGDVIAYIKSKQVK